MSKILLKVHLFDSSTSCSDSDSTVQGADRVPSSESQAGEAVLGARGAGDGFGDDGPVVVSVGAVVEGASGARAEEALDGGEGEAGEVADGVDAVLDEEAGGGGADAGQLPDRPGPQERAHPGGFHGEEASGGCEGAGHGGDHPARPGSGGGPDTEELFGPLLTVVDGISSRIEPPPRRLPRVR